MVSSRLKVKGLVGQFFDRGRNKRNTEEFVACYDEIRSSMTKEELQAKSEELNANLNSFGQTSLVQDSLTINADEKTKGIWSILVPVKGYFITPLVIDINILVFLLMIISGINVFAPDNESLLKWGANFRPLTLAGEPWRLVTNYFLHIGIFHFAV